MENNNEHIPAEEMDEDERRGITSQIAKNKGLTPYQNRKLKNPRVRHKHKYKKALIRQKGMVSIMTYIQVLSFEVEIRTLKNSV